VFALPYQLSRIGNVVPIRPVPAGFVELLTVQVGEVSQNASTSRPFYCGVSDGVESAQKQTVAELSIEDGGSSLLTAEAIL